MDAVSCPRPARSTVAAVPRPKTYPDDLRDRLVAGAIECLRHDLPSHMSLRELAASVDTSTNAIYTLFGSKDDLIEAVIVAVKPSFASALVDASREGDGLDALRNCMVHYRDWSVQNPGLYRLLIGSDANGGVFAVGDQAFAAIYDLVAKLIDDGLIREDDPQLVTLSLWMSMHGLVMTEISTAAAGWGDEDCTRILTYHLDAALRGIAAPKAFA